MPKAIYAVKMPVGIAMMLYPTPMISDVSSCPGAVFGAVSPKPAVIIVTTARYIAWECEGQREKPLHPIESRAQSEVHFGYRPTIMAKKWARIATVRTADETAPCAVLVGEDVMETALPPISAFRRHEIGSGEWARSASSCAKISQPVPGAWHCGQLPGSWQCRRQNARTT